VKIVGLEIFPLTVEFKRVIEESFGTVGLRENDVVIVVHTDEGISGLGEGSTLGPFYSGESQGTVIDIIAHHLFPKVLVDSDPFNLELIHRRMDEVVYGNYVAKAAVDFALHDIIGRALDIPVCRFIGGAHRTEIPLRYAVGIERPEVMAARAQQAVQAGFTGIKMKVGLNPAEDVERVAAIRQAVGDEVIIDVDVNGAYRPKEAIETIRRMEAHGPLLIEQPVHRDDLEGMALVRRRVEAPIGACEAAITLPQIQRIIGLGAADFFNYKISRSGGFFRGGAAVQMIDAAGLFAVGSEQLGFGVELAAQAHFAAAHSTLMLPGGYAAGILGMAGARDNLDFDGDIVTNSPRVSGGRLSVPQGPGLGVELRRDQVSRHLTPGREPIVVGETNS